MPTIALLLQQALKSRATTTSIFSLWFGPFEHNCTQETIDTYNLNRGFVISAVRIGETMGSNHAAS